jgi:hypothetical protein
MNTNIKSTPTEPVNFRINTEMVVNLKRLARHVSYHLDDDYTYVDIIRCLLAEHFPVPETDLIADTQSKQVQDICSRITRQAALAGVPYISSTFTSSTSIEGTTISGLKQNNLDESE